MGVPTKIDPINKNSRHKTEVFIALFLIFGLLIIYSQARHHDFVVYDDRTYITGNPNVLEGLTPESFRWAFSFKEKDKTYWHPITWLSHMLDVQLFGMNAGSHLMINLMVHTLNTLLLLYVFRRMTGKLWPSAIVAALFALHPLNVESVAWVAARKNLLSTMFWMFTILAYVRYVEKSDLKRYALILAVFSLGLLTKPMLVTLPCVLLLLDFWPLRRFQIGQRSALDHPNVPMGRLILEKAPMLVLSAVSVYISTFSLYNYGDLVAVESVPMRLRVANALVSYVAYLGKMAVPLNLTCFYPFPIEVPLWKSTGAVALLTVVTITAARLLRQHPYFLIGWLWYLGTLFPVIGLMQAGLWPAVADRFVYVPLIGIYVIIAWSLAELSKKMSRSVVWITTSATILILALVGFSHKQVGYWKNSITLFSHAVAVTKENYLSHYALGYAYEQKRKVDDAIFHYKAALEINPNEVDVHYNLAILMASKGHLEEAIRYYKNVLRIEPTDAQAHNNLGNIFFRQEKWDKAVRQYQEAIHINSEYAMAHNNLGATMMRQGRIPKAVQHFRAALRIKPEDEQTRRYLQLAIAQLGDESKTSAPAMVP